MRVLKLDSDILRAEFRLQIPSPYGPDSFEAAVVVYHDLTRGYWKDPAKITVELSQKDKEDILRSKKHFESLRRRIQSWGNRFAPHMTRTSKIALQNVVCHHLYHTHYPVPKRVVRKAEKALLDHEIFVRKRKNMNMRLRGDNQRKERGRKVSWATRYLNKVGQATNLPPEQLIDKAKEALRQEMIERTGRNHRGRVEVRWEIDRYVATYLKKEYGEWLTVDRYDGGVQ